MNILLMSDTHGDREIINRIKGYYPDVGYVIHCGDSELEATDDYLQSVIYVKGNCDADKAYLDEQVVSVGDKNFFVTHGHLYNVKSTLMPISYRAQEVGAHIVCFGHSHILGAEKIGDTIFLNPGSLKAPRGRKEKTFMLLTIEGNDLKVKCLDENNNLIQQILFTL